MIREEVINSINDISMAQDEASYDCSICILEYYDKMATILENCDDSTYFDDDAIFQEAADAKEQSIGGKIINAIRKIVNAISNAFSSFFGKITNGASREAVEVKQAFNECRKKVSRRKATSFFDKLKKFRKEHPVAFTVGAVATTGGVMYGGLKAADYGGKKHAMKNLTKEEQEFISKHFDPDTDSITIPYELGNMYDVAKNGYNKYKVLLDQLFADLRTSSEEPTPEQCNAYFKTPDKFNKLINDIGDIETYMAERNILSGFSGKTTIGGGVKGWNSTMSKYESIVSDAEQCYATITVLTNVIFNAILKISDHNEQEKYSKIYMEKISKLTQRHSKAMTDIGLISYDMSSMTATLQNFLPKYYAISAKIEEVEKEIAQCLVFAAKLVSIASNKPTENEADELIELTEKRRIAEAKLESVKTEITRLNVNKGKLIDEIGELEKKKKDLDDTISKINNRKTSETEDESKDDDK